MRLSAGIIAVTAATLAALVTPLLAQDKSGQQVVRPVQRPVPRELPPANYEPPATGASYHVGTIAASTGLSQVQRRQTDIRPNFESLWPTPLPDDGHAIRSFLFRFGNGDHKLKRLTLWPTLRRAPGSDRPDYVVRFHDQDPDDPFSFRATLLDLNGIAIRDTPAMRTRSWRDLPATSDITEAERAKFQCVDERGRVPLLTGFHFAREGGDANVREIGVMCVPRMTETCTRAPDGSCLAPTRSRMELRATYDAVWRHEGGVDFRTLQTSFGSPGDGQSAQVSLVWVPASIIDECRLFSGRDVRTFIQTVEGRRFALMGFRFEFLNTDHHLLEIGVDPESRTEQIRFQDNNRDDSFQFRVQLCFFK